jgi:undecaprenyl-phosphate 4-deoxy-4-formamido-L-arabinose transferase
MTDISIIIPVFNSEEILAELSKQIDLSLTNTSYELILINDCSKDNSWDIISSLQKENEHIIGVNLRKNSGQDNAIMAGLNFSSGEYAVIMDDDLQHSPKDILLLVNECKKGFDVCYANFNKKKQKWWKNVGSWLNGRIAEILIKKPKNIYLSPFQVLHKDIVKEVIKYKGPYPYVQGLILRVTDNLTQINIDHYKRLAGKGNFNLIRSIIVFVKLMTSFSVIPLRIATVMGFVTAFIGFAMIPYYLAMYFFNDEIIEGWTSLMIIILMLGGLLLISLGMLGEYIGRMFLDINQKPQFVIKKVLKK